MPNPYNPNPYNETRTVRGSSRCMTSPAAPGKTPARNTTKGWCVPNPLVGDRNHILLCGVAIGVAMMIINHLLRMGKISAPQSWSQNNRQTGQPYTVRPIYADPQKVEKMRRDAQRVVQRAEEAAHKAEKRVEIYQNADRAQAYDPEQTARQNERGRKDKGEGWSIALTVLGVIFPLPWWPTCRKPCIGCRNLRRAAVTGPGCSRILWAA